MRQTGLPPIRVLALASAATGQGQLQDCLLNRLSRWGGLDVGGLPHKRALSYCTVLVQRLGSGDVGSGIQVGTLAGGAFTITTFPNLAMSVPLAGLRLRYQRRERVDAALGRAKSAGVLPELPCVVSASHEPNPLCPLICQEIAPAQEKCSCSLPMSRDSRRAALNSLVGCSQAMS